VSKPDFVHLHAHSEYSLLDGTVRYADEKGNPSEFLRAVAAQGVKALAMTDHGNLYGAVEFYQACQSVGIKPIIGCEVYVAPGSRLDRGARSEKDATRHLILLAQDEEGYRNLMALSTAAFLEGFHYKPRIDRELLARHAKGLIALSGCLKSEVSQAILSGNLTEAESLVGTYVDILGRGNFFLEAMDHGLESQRQVLSGVRELSRRTGIPLVATNDCHYFRQDDWEAHDARVCIATGALLEETRRLRFETHEFYYKSAEEMARLFSYQPEAVRNTVAIADRCNLSLGFDQILLPHYPVPEGHTADSYMEQICWEGLKARLGRPQSVYETRLRYELDIIRKMGFASYFLIVWDFIRYARAQAIPVGPGRGSGAGSLVAWCMDITRVDPIEHGLLFERFLNPDRKSMPDLDIDFSDDGRERVIEYVRRKYGEANVAQIITFSSMNARAVIRDVGRVMNLPIQEVDRLAKLIPGGPDSSLAGAEQAVPELKEAQKYPRIAKLFAIARKLEGLKRHTGVHAAGTVITKEPVVCYSPLARGSHDVVTTQYNDEALLRLGLLKVDFLGLRTLTVIRRAMEMARRRAPDFDVEKVPFDDAATFELLRSGHTLGVFQLDSTGMRDLLRRLKPTAFQDISAVLALYRPGPMESGMLDEFVERKHGHHAVRYGHPLLREILQDTYGCIVYQEQVMEISKRLAGFTPGDADVLRKAMGKKIPEILEKQRGKFVEGAKKKGIPEKLVNRIFDQIAKFGGYGFNKSHATAYAVLAYQTAYLKANYPLEFMTALLSSEIGHGPVAPEARDSKLITYVEETRRMGLELLPADVNRSGRLFEIDPQGANRIRYALLAVKNVGSGAVEALLEARRQGPFLSLQDLARRVDLRQVNRKVLESLIKAGALDSLAADLVAVQARPRLLAALDTSLERLSRLKEDIARGQGLLFAGEDGGHEADLPAAKPWSEHELLNSEKEVLGFYFSGHPLTRYAHELSALSTHRVAEVAPGTQGPVRLAGMLTGIRRLVTRDRKEAYARARLEDLTGEMGVLVFPKAYAAGLSRLLENNRMVVVAGRLSARGDDEGTPEIIAEEIQPLEAALGRWARSLVISLSTEGLEEESLVGLRKLLAGHPGSTPVYLELQTRGQGTAMVATEEHVALSGSLFEALERTLGEKTWRIESAS